MEPVHLKDHPLADEVKKRLHEGSLTLGSPIAATKWTEADRERLIKACHRVNQLRQEPENR